MLGEVNLYSRIYLAYGYTDLRFGIDGLARMVQDHFELNPFQKGALFLFCGRHTDRIIQEEQQGAHPHVVWWDGNGSWAEHLLTISRRVFVGLKEGDTETVDECGGKVRISWHSEKSFEKREAGCLHGKEYAQPFLLLPPKQRQPTVKQLLGDAEAFAELFHRRRA